jgi:hypothetical protein
MRWHYKIGKNETFLASRFFNNELRYDLASRHLGEDNYWIHRGQILPISISGTDDVTLTVHKTKFSDNGEYCCEVIFKSNNEKHQNKTCTKLFVYGMIFIGYCYMIH